MSTELFALLMKSYFVLLASTGTLLGLLLYEALQLSDEPQGFFRFGTFGIAVALLSLAGWRITKQAEAQMKRNKSERRLLKSAKQLFLISSLSLGGAVAFALSLTPAAEYFVGTVIAQLPQIKLVSVTIAEKLVDYIVGGIVFEVARSWFTRRAREIVSRVS